MTNANGMKLAADLLEAPISHIPAERTRSAALTIAEAGMNGPWDVEDVREMLDMLRLNRQTLTHGMFGENDV